MFNNAKWIWKTKSYKPNSYTWFFKDYDIRGKIENAEICISAHNHFKLMVNGKLVSGLVSPAPSNVSSNKLYLKYQLKDFLKQGNNTVEVIVLYLGGSGQNYVNGLPGFIMEGEVVTKNKIISIISDTSWNRFLNIPYQDDMPYQQKRRVTPIQYYDATIKPSRDHISKVVILDNDYDYHEQKIPEGAVYESIVPKLLHQENDVYVFDVGRIISGFVQLSVRAKKTVELKIRYSEDLLNQRVKHNVANENSDSYYDVIKVSKDENIMQAADFTYKAFRYFEITGDLLALESFSALAMQASTDIHIVGDLYVEDDSYINDLVNIFKHTQLNNTLGLLVDCPHREQAQYLGDSLLQSLSISYNILERKELLDKVLDDFKYAQYDDGTFPFVSPGSTDIDEFSLKIPEYDLYFIELVYQRYVMNHDDHILDKYYLNIMKIINHYLSKVDDYQLIRKNDEWHISDWPYPTVDHQGHYLTYENMLFYRVLDMFIKMYQKRENMHVFQKFIEGFKQQIKKTFKYKGLFLDHESSEHKHQGIQAFALMNGFFEKDEIEYAIKYVIDQGFSSNIIFGRYVLEALFECKKYEEAYQYLFTYEKGWGNIIRKKSPTMWEGFDDIESHSHAWGLYPIYFLQRYLLGIRFDQDNPLHIELAPHFLKDMKEVSGKVVTERGVFHVSYKVENKQLEINMKIPSGIRVYFRYFDFKKTFIKNTKYVLNL